jgi:hypothetical protein
MSKHRQTFSEYAASLIEPEDGQSRFGALEAIRVPYRKRAKIVALARAIVLIAFGIVTTLAGLRYAIAPDLSALAPLSSVALFLAAYFSPKFYSQLGVDRGLPPLPFKLQTLIESLSRGDVRSSANRTAVPSSYYLSPFAILLTSDIDDDWALVSDHRLRVLKHPVELDMKSLDTPGMPNPAHNAHPDGGDAAKQEAKEEALAPNHSRDAAGQHTSKNQRKNSPDWLRSLTWRQMKYNLPTALEAETSDKRKRLLVSLALRHGRAALRGHTKQDKGLAGAIKAAVNALQSQVDENGNPLKLGLNGSDSDDWIKPLLLGTYFSGRIKDCLQGKPQLPLGPRAEGRE